VWLDSRLVGRKRRLHNATGRSSLLTVLALLPKVFVAMRLFVTHCDMRILMLPLSEGVTTTMVCRHRLTHSLEGMMSLCPATVG
jgi:hypothetical protein